ncbi:cysteine--tRNA ligase [candidate division WOR-1 bacterium RIFOXYA12_FULL_43_27]|uniref:Cysteine--tRNA ligase n=1 Tax=candidate division WOR-1 bacterium RIFOXYC2_FULL_46_14 TaxID=1802587 RepID=A0A1F4U564_UNCSA|nr:MAG: cysteine--tRNA ligase [candidate division WOR-1 bacterium RIFOXYA12_FULL_43_27]OGC20261.1 MAG: cysteine--tRNA ligase [candidate division WOR-1 bacterium RIFOXYB2_FULL_46_45]OGC32002.1 MAG: cysteine--tRNA ligase [candidate division WOR-1 bacterium RIFOXYA2_FULL_46_56]OGC40108.1 MAG: cysteine--tRNA ligase [candidate division WOR-1 bacterium RIFOXYC2_FULL_46_14]
MPLFIYNTLTQKKEEFVPLHPNEVKMYVCGVTPYDEAHLGHGRAYVTFDIIRRFLEYSGYKVTYIQNVTDIDDKLINKANGERRTVNEIAQQYFDSYLEVMEKLGVLNPTRYVKATEHIPEMVKWVKGLEAGGYAYQIDHDVYFEVGKFKDYGKLSKRKLDEMRSGARVEVDSRKKDPFDFALWKGAKEGEPSWDSPWGKGRPGWHIECSVMSTKYLGESFDIHGGGLDLIFPHHENEIAQTEALTCKPWVKYWVHNGFVNVDKQKMSKSLGNFFTLKDIFKKYDPMVVRFFLLSTHYRSPIDFSDDQLKAAEKGLGRLRDTIDRIQFVMDSIEKPKESHGLDSKLLELDEDFIIALNDDFNAAGAIGVLFEIVAFANKIMEENPSDKALLLKIRKSLIGYMELLGLRVEGRDRSKTCPDNSEEIEKMIAEREAARKNKDFKKADQIRNDLLKKGIILEDTAQGVRWKGIT